MRPWRARVPCSFPPVSARERARLRARARKRDPVSGSPCGNARALTAQARPGAPLPLTIPEHRDGDERLRSPSTRRLPHGLRSPYRRKHAPYRRKHAPYRRKRRQGPRCQGPRCHARAFRTSSAHESLAESPDSPAFSRADPARNSRTWSARLLWRRLLAAAAYLSARNLLRSAATRRVHAALPSSLK